MVLPQYAAGYRGILRELRKSLDPKRQVNQTIRSQFRSIVEKVQKADSANGLNDINNAIFFLRSQREHKRLLERYNPLFDLTDQERIKATANRVGFNLPKSVPKSEA